MQILLDKEKYESKVNQDTIEKEEIEDTVYAGKPKKVLPVQFFIELVSISIIIGLFFAGITSLIMDYLRSSVSFLTILHFNIHIVIVNTIILVAFGVAYKKNKTLFSMKVTVKKTKEETSEEVTLEGVKPEETELTCTLYEYGVDGEKEAGLYLDILDYTTGQPESYMFDIDEIDRMQFAEDGKSLYCKLVTKDQEHYDIFLTKDSDCSVLMSFAVKHKKLMSSRGRRVT